MLEFNSTKLLNKDHLVIVSISETGEGTITIYNINKSMDEIEKEWIYRLLFHTDVQYNELTKVIDNYFTISSENWDDRIIFEISKDYQVTITNDPITMHQCHYCGWPAVLFYITPNGNIPLCQKHYDQARGEK